MNTCKLCGKEGKEGLEFYSRIKSRCKECHKKKVRENRSENFSHYQEYEARRYKENPKRKEYNEWYAKTDRGKQSKNKSIKKWQSENPIKRAAHVLLGNQIKGGYIIKPGACEKCGKSGVKIHGHHNDYMKPLEVVWVCAQCHTNIHKGEL